MTNDDIAKEAAERMRALNDLELATIASIAAAGYHAGVFTLNADDKRTKGLRDLMEWLRTESANEPS